MKVRVHGSGGYLPYPDKPLPAFSVEHDGSVYLFDAGEGTQTQLVKHSVSVAKLECVTISHMHGDHVLGLPGVLTRRANEARESSELSIIGPGNLRDYIENLQTLLEFDLTYDWKFYGLENGFSLQLNRFSLTAVELDHRTQNYGFSFQLKPEKRKFHPEKARNLGVPEGPLWSKLQHGETIELDSGEVIHPRMVSDPPPTGPTFVYLTDTRPRFDFPEGFDKPDLLVHEGMFLAEHQEHAVRKKHSTAREAARVAQYLDANRLLLTHFSHRYDNPLVLRNEAKKLFQDTELAKPGLEIDL